MSTCRFYRFMFRVSTSQTALTSSLMMSCPNDSTSIYWIIRFEGNAGVCNRSEIQLQSFIMHFS